MTVQTLLLIQLVIDIFLLLMLGLFIWHINRHAKDSRSQLSRAEMEELKRLIDESGRLSTQFLASLDEGRKIMKSLAYSLDEREGRIKDLLAKTETLLMRAYEDRATVGRDESRYDDALSLMEKGVSPKEIGERLDLTAGEIELIRKIKDFKGKAIS